MKTMNKARLALSVLQVVALGLVPSLALAAVLAA